MIEEELQTPGSVGSSSASAASPSPNVSDSGAAGVAGLPPLPGGRVPVAGKSPVWPHFKKYSVFVDSDKEFDEDGNKKKIEKKRASCRHCDKNYAADPSVNGTSSLLAHLEVCPKLPGRKPDKKQKTLCFGEGGLVARGATQADCLSACVEMVIIDELAFSFVEVPFFCNSSANSLNSSSINLQKP
ncbi:hypothetical protein ACHQM5_002627 [Ranunculus cassubicifolius]